MDKKFKLIINMKVFTHLKKRVDLEFAGYM